MDIIQLIVYGIIILIMISATLLIISFSFLKSMSWFKESIEVIKGKNKKKR